MLKKKSAVIASNSELAEDLSAKLKCVGAIPTSAAASLGVDLAAGKKRGKHGKNCVRAQRFSKGLARTKRLNILRQTIGGRRASQVASAGALAATVLM